MHVKKRSVLVTPSGGRSKDSIIKKTNHSITSVQRLALQFRFILFSTQFQVLLSHHWPKHIEKVFLRKNET